MHDHDTDLHPFLTSSLNDSVDSWLAAEQRLSEAALGDLTDEQHDDSSAVAESALLRVFGALPSFEPSFGFADRVVRAAMPRDLGTWPRALTGLALATTGLCLLWLVPILRLVVGSFDALSVPRAGASALTFTLQAVHSVLFFADWLWGIARALAQAALSPPAIVAGAVAIAVSLAVLQALNYLLSSTGRSSHAGL